MKEEHTQSIDVSLLATTKTALRLVLIAETFMMLRLVLSSFRILMKKYATQAENKNYL